MSDKETAENLQDVLVCYRKTRDWIARHSRGQVSDLMLLEARRDMDRYARLVCEMLLDNNEELEASDGTE